MADPWPRKEEAEREQQLDRKRNLSSSSWYCLSASRVFWVSWHKIIAAQLHPFSCVLCWRHSYTQACAHAGDCRLLERPELMFLCVHLLREHLLRSGSNVPCCFTTFSFNNSPNRSYYKPLTLSPASSNCLHPVRGLWGKASWSYGMIQPS